MKCPNGCGETMKETRRNRSFNRGEDEFVIIKDLQVFECSQCGEIIIPASSSREIDRLLKDSPEVSEIIEVPAYQAKSA